MAMNVDVRQPVNHLLIQDIRQGMNIGDGVHHDPPRVFDLMNVRFEKPSVVSVVLRTIFIASIVFLCFWFPCIAASSILAGLALGFLPLLGILDVAESIFRRNV